MCTQSSPSVLEQAAKIQPLIILSLCVFQQPVVYGSFVYYLCVCVGAQCPALVFSLPCRVGRCHETPCYLRFVHPHRCVHLGFFFPTLTYHYQKHKTNLLICTS